MGTVPGSEEAMPQFVVSARLKEGAGPSARELLEGGPAVDLDESAFERHAVFMANDQLLFVFESWHAREDTRRLLQSPSIVWGADRLEELVEGELTLHRERFSWERPAAVEWIAYGPDPGPGDSDGGERD
jgi:hypothetical protein